MVQRRYLKMRKMNEWKVTMVSPSQIASKHFQFCTTPKAVQNFCTRYGVNHFWWTPPQGSRKVFMIDAQSFRNCWNQVYGKNPTTTPSRTRTKTTTTTYYSRTTSPKKTTTSNSPKTTSYPKTYAGTRIKGTKSTFRRVA
jgi:hypothetical protein